MSLVVTGMLNKQIADVLGTSEKTIKIHRAHVMQKMQAISAAELVRMATRTKVLLFPLPHFGRVPPGSSKPLPYRTDRKYKRPFRTGNPPSPAVAPRARHMGPGASRPRAFR